MRIYLDGMFYKCSGVGRVYENLLSEFIERTKWEVIHTAVPAMLREQFLDRFPSPRVRPMFLEYGPMGFGDLFRKGIALRPLAGKVSLFLFPGHNVPLFMPEKYILTVNDVTAFSPHFRLPWYRKAGFRWLLSRAVHGAETVVTISKTVKGDLVREFGLPPGRIRVISPWIKETFFEPPPAAGSPVSGEYLLYLGLRIPHKNVEGVIRAFSLLLGEFPELRLVIAGSRYSTPDMVDRWKGDPRLMGRLVEIFDPSDDDIARLFGGAKAFVFPSFAEGFGLPPLEAMASGVPVVCSDIPVFREVYGDAVRYVDPSRPESIAEGVREILKDDGLSARFALAGRARAALYRRDRSLNAYLDMIRST